MTNTENQKRTSEPLPDRSGKKSDREHTFFRANQTYSTIFLYALGLILGACLIIRFVFHWNNTFQIFFELFSNLSSFMFGILIAFMVNPLVHSIHRSFFHKNEKKYTLLLSIVISYLIVFGFLTICLIYVIPQLIESIGELSTNLPTMYYGFSRWLRTFAYNNDHLNSNLVNRIINTLTPKIMELSTQLASKLIPWLYSTSISVIRWCFTFIIAIIVSIYLLLDKQIIFRNTKRLLYAFLPQNFVNHSIEIMKNCNNIFTGYIVAKAIDSLIIGILCFLLMVILKLPYALLISVIVGITNMIPYFGPYIGAIPGVFILMVTEWKYGLIFLVMILALQQFDGLILGPRILGDSTGLRPLLILFAITLGGAYAGVIGMFLGVPVIAVIQYLLNLLISKRLKDRKIEI